MAHSRLLPPFVGNRLWFPDPAAADVEGLVAFGGEMTVPRLLLAYKNGIFPWSHNPVTWWSPDPRGIIELEAFHVPRSLAKVLRRGMFTFTTNHAFPEVIKACSAPGKGREDTWISPEFVSSYVELHRQGHAHSVECWFEGKLAGGIYGVAIGGFFAGESMFHLVADASKAALHFLVGHLKTRNFQLFDVQMLTPVTTALGGTNVSRSEYLRRLREAVVAKTAFLT